jgi:hypothetical protein
MKLVSFGIAIFVLFATVLASAPSGPGGGCYCTMVWSPVCGADGKTYGNACSASCAGVAVKSTGECAFKGIYLDLKNIMSNSALGATYLTQTVSDYNGNSSLILTPTQLPSLLSSGMVTALDQYNKQHNYSWQERVVLDSQADLIKPQSALKAQYYEDNNAAKIVLDVPANGLIYDLRFFPSGLDTPAAGVNYTGTPEVTFLGQKYGIDSATLTTSRVDLYPGTSVSKFAGEAYTAGVYTVTLESVASDGSAAYVSIKKSGTVITGSDRILVRSGKTYDGGKLSVYVEAAAKVISAENVETGRATMRIVSGKLSLMNGNDFPFDSNYVVKILSTSDQITDILLLSKTARTGISGTYAGIDIGGSFLGPKATLNATKAFFSVNFIGPKAPAAAETIKIVGDGTKITSIVWQSQDGITETLNYDSTYYNPNTATGWNGLKMTAGQYAVVTDRVVRLTSLYNKSGIGMVYSVTYSGTTVTDIAIGTQFSFGQAGLYTTCQFNYAGMVSNIPTANLVCTMGGSSINIANELAHVAGLQQPLGMSIATIDLSSAWKASPVIYIDRPSVGSGTSYNRLKITYDATSAYKGFTASINASTAELIKTNKATLYANDKKQILADGTEISATASDITVVVPGGTGDDRRKAHLEIAAGGNIPTPTVTKPPIVAAVSSDLKARSLTYLCKDGTYSITASINEKGMAVNTPYTVNFYAKQLTTDDAKTTLKTKDVIAAALSAEGLPTGWNFIGSATLTAKQPKTTTSTESVTAKISWKPGTYVKYDIGYTINAGSLKEGDAKNNGYFRRLDSSVCKPKTTVTPVIPVKTGGTLS